MNKLKNRGVVYVVGTFVLLPVFAVFMAMAVEMMSFALSSRVAFNYAMIGTTAIARAFEVRGGGYEIDRFKACNAALRSICSQTQNICDRPDGVLCIQRDNEFFIRVRAPRYIFFGSLFNSLPNYAEGYNIIKLRSGIEIEDMKP